METPPAGAATAAGPLCAHCQKYKRTRPRGLCRRCHQDKSIREQYPPISPHGKRMPNVPFGPRPLPKSPTQALPGSEDKILVLQERIGLGLNPWHPLDRQKDPEIDRLPDLLTIKQPAACQPTSRVPRPAPSTRPAPAPRPRSPYLPFDPPIEEILVSPRPPARYPADSPTGWNKPRRGVVMIQAGASGRYRLLRGRRPRHGKNVVCAIRTRDTAWLVELLTTLWEERPADGPWLRLQKQDLELVRHRIHWNRGQKPIEQRGLFDGFGPRCGRRHAARASTLDDPAPKPVE